MTNPFARKMEPHFPPIPTDAQVQPDKELIDKLRANFSHQAVAESLIAIMKDLLTAIGVQVNTQIVRIDKKHKVDTQAVMSGIPRLSATIAAIYAGSAINPIDVIEERNNVTQQPWKYADREAPPSVDEG